MSIIEIKDLFKSYKIKEKNLEILCNLSVKFESGKFYAIMGHSGSGKTTLLNLIGGLESITSGTIKIDNINISKLNQKELSNIRKEYIGYVFQDMFLDKYLKSFENVMIPMYLNNKEKYQEKKDKAINLLDYVDLKERINHFPGELSGGERQRVAIARALANDPKIILADEPTGNLDKKNEKKIFGIFKNLAESGKCIIVVSHSNEVKEFADVIYNLDEGKLNK